MSLFPGTVANHPERIIICRSPDAISTTIDEETVILNSSTGAYSSLEKIGAIIWDNIKDPTSFRQLIDMILADYEVTEDACIEDLCTFLEEMLEQRLIEIKNEDGGELFLSGNSPR